MRPEKSPLEAEDLKKSVTLAFLRIHFIKHQVDGVVFQKKIILAVIRTNTAKSHKPVGS